MKALIQRVTRSAVSVEDRAVGSTGRGLVVLLGVARGDTEADAHYLAHRTMNLRVFPDHEGRMNRSLQDIHGEALVISQFTLYADTRSGNRPNFVAAAPPETAQPLYEAFLSALRAVLGNARVATGRFGEHMTVEILNDGPVTLELTSSGK